MFYAVPDPTFQVDADPDPNFFKEKKMSSKSSFILSKLYCLISSVIMREEG